MVWDLKTIKRLNDDACREAAAGMNKIQIEGVLLKQIVERSGFDLSNCMMCGHPIVCLPDGLPLCDPCAKDIDD